MGGHIASIADSDRLRCGQSQNYGGLLRGVCRRTFNCSVAASGGNDSDTGATSSRLRPFFKAEAGSTVTVKLSNTAGLGRGRMRSHPTEIRRSSWRRHELLAMGFEVAVLGKGVIFLGPPTLLGKLRATILFRASIRQRSLIESPGMGKRASILQGIQRQHSSIALAKPTPD